MSIEESEKAKRSTGLKSKKGEGELGKLGLGVY
jgi:hypothetical protein